MYPRDPPVSNIKHNKTLTSKPSKTQKKSSQQQHDTEPPDHQPKNIAINTKTHTLLPSQALFAAPFFRLVALALPPFAPSLADGSTLVILFALTASTLAPAFPTMRTVFPLSTAILQVVPFHVTAGPRALRVCVPNVKRVRESGTSVV